MTKADLVEHVAEAAGLSKAEAEEVVNTVLDSIVDALGSGDKVELRGFGSFRLRMRRPRQGRNPKTGTTVDVPGKAVPYFKPGKELREMLNPGEAGGEQGADEGQTEAPRDAASPPPGWSS
jgi:integration host factor subunit beta